MELDDGAIFPPNAFPEGTPNAVIRRAALERAPLRGAIRVAVVLVDFPDQQMAPKAAERMQELFFSTGKIATGSATEYYQDVSGGKISLVGEVLGPFRMPKKMTDYAHGKSGFQDGVPEPNIRTLGGDALTAVAGHVDFAHYDNDGNGYVDAFVVVHAGSGAEQERDPVKRANKIWSVKWAVPDRHVDHNDPKAKVFAFLTIPEDANVGVACHELGHLVFGWPDLYDADGSSEGLGNWCLMAGGSWMGVPAGTVPCHPSAWCKANQKWVTVLNETRNRPLLLRDVKSTREVHRLWQNGDAASKEYFLIENRQQKGFDGAMPGNGLLVWHVDDTTRDNKNEKHYMVGLLQADGLNQLASSAGNRGDAGDAFPGSTKKRSFTATTNPSSLSYSGQDSLVTIEKISDSKDEMTMEIKVRAGPGFVPTV